MINKELFVETINFIRDRNDAMRELNHMFTTEFTDSNFYPYMRYDTQIIKLLANSFDYDGIVIGEYIDWFCWEKDFGRDSRLGGITVTNKDNTTTIYDINTAEQLYDFLFEESCSIERG